MNIKIKNKTQWKSHIFGKKGLISSLNQRLFFIKRISSHLPNNKISTIVDAIWTSKLRYGLQLFSEVRVTDDNPQSNIMSQIQKAQNKLLRVLCKVTISDKKSIKDLLSETNMLSVNQMAGQVILTEMWKIINDPVHPLTIDIKKYTNGMETRSVTQKDVIETSTRKGFIGAGSRLWNKAPENIKSAKTIGTAKKAIKSYCSSLPV